MAISEQPATPDANRPAPVPERLRGPGGAVATTSGWVDAAESFTEALYRLAHPLGIHRWRDGYETDVERGWTQYRGSRCTTCDEPWEGW